MSIVTKNGDQGFTNTLSGEKLSKASSKLALQGDLDELSSNIAFFRMSILEYKNIIEKKEEISEFNFWILHVIAVVSTNVSSFIPGNGFIELEIEIIKKLESELLCLKKNIKIPSSFIVSSSNLISCKADIVRVLTRRVERSFVNFMNESNFSKDSFTLIFLNRLSDYFFLLARVLDKSNYIVYDKKIITP